MGRRELPATAGYLPMASAAEKASEDAAMVVSCPSRPVWGLSGAPPALAGPVYRLDGAASRYPSRASGRSGITDRIGGRVGQAGVDSPASPCRDREEELCLSSK